MLRLDSTLFHFLGHSSSIKARRVVCGGRSLGKPERPAERGSEGSRAERVFTSCLAVRQNPILNPS